jgi:uncharacterized membrane protein
MKLTKKNYTEKNINDYYLNRNLNDKSEKRFLKKKNDDKYYINNEDTGYNENNNTKYIMLPHKQNIEHIILNIRDMIFIIIEMLENQKNPIPYILSSDRRIFTFSLFLIIFGTIMLILASLMKSSSNNF